MAYSLIAHTKVAGGNDTGTTGAIDTTGVDLIVLVVSSYSGAGAGSVSVSDSKSNTWSARTEYNNVGSTRVQIFYFRGGTVGSGHTFTWSATSSFASMFVLAFSGSATSPYDAESGSTSANHPGSLTPSEDNMLLISGMCAATGSSYSVADSGWVTIETSDYNGGVSMGGGAAYKIQTTAGAEDPVWSAGSASNMATFKAAAAGIVIPIFMNQYRHRKT